MPAPVSLDDKRAASRLTLLFRAGLAVAALAALLLLVADGNGLLRVAAVLAITAVVMINISVALRPDTAAEVRQLADEIDELRAELAAVAHSARPAADPARWSAEPVGARNDEVPAAEQPRAGRARVTVAGTVPVRPAADEPEPEGGRRRADDPEDGRRRTSEPAAGRRRAAEPDGEPFPDHRTGGDWYADQEPVARPRATSRYASERAAGGVYGGSARSDGPDVRPGAAPGPEAPARPVGVVRHTETVHVTTRHTVVDGTPDPGPGGYGRWTPREEQPWSGHDPERADRWDGYPSREDHPRPDPDWRTSAGGRYGGADERYGHPGGERSGPTGGDSRSRRGAPDRPDPGPAYPSGDAGADDWSEVRAGGRWATVRDDEHGRELRMSERRAALHADGDGTELRVEDHWAAVRRPRRGHPDDGYDRDEPRGAGPEYPRRDGHRPDPDRALPPGGVPVPEQWRPARGDRAADGRSTPHRSGEGTGWPTSPAEPGWSPPRGRRQDDDWPEPSARGRRTEPEPGRYGRPSREHERRADDAPDRWR
ncbi:hypothetical protein [Micromonospora sagamiensis]|uniref:Uncharacterized protein n=1 Tax=Micromonospora sagamiensis TaxID=47875 RepID=A0A562W8Y2_9ACTN|nr:hypothetical protein [Micromonospora sagamiensis]TWJ26739.1 hypothetical protein JD81_00202 [Micromonospora sagamiensis]BCL14374.1 hypothetical protein GCM10017556_21130 [Micromonospora sagamiensis]